MSLVKESRAFLKADQFLDGVDRIFAKLEMAGLVIILSIMILLASTQIILHQFFNTGIEWADTLVRQMVLCLGFVGGALATHEGRHIAIEAVTKFVPIKMNELLKLVTACAACVVLFLILNASFTFIQDEKAANTSFYGDWPIWPIHLVIPISLSLMSFHFLVMMKNAFFVLTGLKKPQPRTESIR